MSSRGCQNILWSSYANPEKYILVPERRLQHPQLRWPRNAMSSMHDVLQNKDLLKMILRANPAEQDSIRALHCAKWVRKDWFPLAKGVLEEPAWRESFDKEAEFFLRQVPLLGILNGVGGEMEDIITRLVSGMRAYRAHPRVQEAGCKALAELAHHPNVAAAIVDAGGLAVVVEAMSAHEAQAGVQEQGCRALQSTFGDFEAGIAARRGIAAVVTAMKTHQGCPFVQQYGSKTLQNLANAGFVTSITGADGICAVLAAITAHPEYGFKALQELARDYTTAVAIVVAGGIPVTLTAMETHRSAHVQQLGCAVLENLACNNANQTAIATAGGIAAVVTAMRTHAGKGHEALQETGCGALGNIGWSDLALQMCIKDEGGEGVVQAAVTASGATAKCVDSGYRLLGKLARV